MDRGICIKRYSKPATKLFNIIAADVDRPLPDITHRLSYPDLLKDIEQVFEKLQPSEREVRSADNEWYIARILPYRTAADRIDGVILTFVNITRHKAAEDNVWASEQRMRLIGASTRDYAIATMDDEGRITSWNSGAERLFGYSEEEIVGQSGALLFLPEDREKKQFQQELRKAFAEGCAEDDRWHLRKDGSRVFCSGISSPLVDESTRGFVKIARDLTGSKRAQDQQAASLEWEQQERLRAQEAARLRDEFFAVLSHELKQPLNLIQLTAEVLSRLSDTEKVPAIARAASTIKHSVESQVKIIDDLMDLSRLHTGKLSLNRTQVNFSEAVVQVIHIVTPDAQQKKIALSYEPAPMDLIVHGDVVRVEQTVWNLLNNALKFTPSGGKVHIRLSQRDNFACMEVADTGRGIPTEFLPYVFDMFKQADSGTTRQYGGIGIGLALVKELVISHGGRVEADSGGAGQGAQFGIFLPLSLSRQTVLPVIEEGSKRLAGKRYCLSMIRWTR